MTAEKDYKRISKFLSLVLRHRPEVIGITLDDNGYADVNGLIAKMNEKGSTVNREILEEVVATNSKQRFAFDQTGTKIRANQGHSLDVELGLQEMDPPTLLYHGTGEKSVSSISITGLEKKQRQHVHLSADVETAKNVGQRHGVPKIFVVSAAQMKVNGFIFYLSKNKVWLTEEVPAEYLKLL